MNRRNNIDCILPKVKNAASEYSSSWCNSNRTGYCHILACEFFCLAHKKAKMNIIHWIQIVIEFSLCNKRYIQNIHVLYKSSIVYYCLYVICWIERKKCYGFFSICICRLYLSISILFICYIWCFIFAVCVYRMYYMCGDNGNYIRKPLSSFKRNFNIFFSVLLRSIHPTLFHSSTNCGDLFSILLTLHKHSGEKKRMNRITVRACVYVCVSF